MRMITDDVGPFWDVTWHASWDKQAEIDTWLKWRNMEEEERRLKVYVKYLYIKV
jgi:hypothetical protein